MGQTRITTLRDLKSQKRVVGLYEVLPGVEEVDQIIIARYGRNGTHPAGGVFGSGKHCKIRGTTYGSEVVFPTVGKPIIASEGWDEVGNMSTFENGTSPVETCQQPFIKNLTIEGVMDQPNYQDVDSCVNSDPALTASNLDKECGLYLRGAMPLVEDVNFYHIAGTACYVRSGVTSDLSGALLSGDGEFVRVRDCWAQRCYRGFVLDSNDIEVSNLGGRAMRQGVYIPPGVGGLKLFGIFHFYGIGTGSGTDADRGEVLRLEATDACLMENSAWYVDNVEIGLNILSNNQTIGFVRSRDVLYGAVRMAGDKNTILSTKLFPKYNTGEVRITGRINSVESGVTNFGGASGGATPHNDALAFTISGSGGDGFTLRQRFETVGGGPTEATCVKLAGSIDNSTMELKLNVLGTGVNCAAATIGTGNFWVISGGASVAELVPPSGLSFSNTPNSNANYFLVNGVRKYLT